MGYGARLKRYRELRGLTQDDLARETGIPSTAISRIERGGRKVTLEEAVVLAEVLRVTLAQLAGVEELVLAQSNNTQQTARQEVAMTLRAMADQLEAVAS